MNQINVAVSSSCASVAARVWSYAVPVCLLIAMMFQAGEASAVIYLPFSTLDFGATGQRIESGAVGVSASGTTSIASQPITADTSDLYLLSVSSADWRDRGDASPVEPLVLMGEDHIKLNSGTITLTFDDLPAGKYRATSYHIDSQFPLTTAINISVTDTLGSNVLQAEQGDAGAHGRIGSPISPITVTTAIMEASQAMFEFTADGIDPVSISFTGLSNGSLNAPQFPISGLQLELVLPSPVPEPHSGLLAMLGWGLISAMRRRR